MQTAERVEPKVGERFPTLTLLDVGHKTVRVPDDFAGQTVVLSWYPFAFSPICTEEFTGFTQVDAQFRHLNATVVAVSCDHWYTTEAYRRSLGATYPFLSDWDRTEAQKLGIFHDKKRRPDRHIYILDKSGVLRWHRDYSAGGCPTLDDFRDVLQQLA